MRRSSVIRRGAKRLIETVAASSLSRRLARPHIAGKALILAYHNVLPPGIQPTGERSLHLPLDEFRRQLDYLGQNHPILPLEDLLQKPFDGTAVALTFDDAYHSALTAGLPETGDRGFPTTVFVAPGLLGSSLPWWDAAADPHSGSLDDGLRRHVLGQLAGETSRILDWARTHGIALQGPTPATQIATESELRDASAIPGVSFGAHSWSHPSLPDLPEDQVSRELDLPLAWLREHFEHTLPIIAYPYGRSSPPLRRRVRDAGYLAGLEISGGWFRRSGVDAMEVPRYNVPSGLTLAGFIARVSGVLR